MANADDGKHSAKATLYLPSGVGGGGFLTIPVGDLTIMAEFTPAKVELMLVLNRALREDQPLPVAARGWRAAEQISAVLDFPVEEGSLRRAVSQINRTFREAVRSADPDLEVPPLLSTRRKIGIRLSQPLSVVFPQLPRRAD